VNRKQRKKQKQKRQRPLYIFIAGIILIVSAILIWVLTPGDALAPGESSIENTSQVPRVGLVQAVEAFENQQALFVDVRPGWAYDISHIPGAVSIPLEEIPQRMGELEGQDWIIPY
jgi:hypothetical protein